jgi:hypothetical protein
MHACDLIAINPLVVMQGACDTSGCFKAIAIGWSTDEDNIRQYKQAWCRHLETIVGDGYSVAAGDCYPPAPGLLTPCSEAGCLLEHKSYNCLQSLAATRVQHPTQQLQYRWRKLLDTGFDWKSREPEHLANIITCFCILHNLSISTPDDDEEAGDGNADELEGDDDSFIQAECAAARAFEHRHACANHCNNTPTADSAGPRPCPDATFWQSVAAAEAETTPVSPAADSVDAYFASGDSGEETEEIPTSLDATAMFTIICRPELKEEMRKWLLLQKQHSIVKHSDV